MNWYVYSVSQLICVFILTLAALASSAAAQTIPSALKPYAIDYKDAVKSKNRIAVAEAAYDLWQASEGMYGDAELTGDLAHLYARRSLNLPVNEKAGRKTYKAFKRSLELAKFSPKPFETDLSRRLDMIEALLRGVYNKPAKREIDAVRSSLKVWDDDRTLYHADFNALIARYAVFRAGDPEEALAPAMAAKAIYQQLEQTGTKRALDNHKVLIRAMMATGADLVEQSLMAQEYAHAAVNGSKSSRLKVDAITLYRKAYGIIESEGQLVAATAAGLVKPDVVALLEAGDMKMLKVQPMMPPRAVESGYANVQFTVSPDGRVEDIEIVSQSDDMFGMAAKNAVSQWQYNPNRIEINGEPIVERIEFNLYGTHGQLR